MKFEDIPMLKVRLMRIGGKKKPFYRVVVVDERAKRTGGYIELLGTYNPLTEPKDIKLKQDKIDYWMKQGAQPSLGYLRMIGKAPQRPPRKPKKEKKKEESQPEESKVTEATQADSQVGEMAKSETAKVIGEVEPSGASVTDEPTLQEAKPEEKKDEGSA